jgi:hypothetical protein
MIKKKGVYAILKRGFSDARMAAPREANQKVKAGRFVPAFLIYGV